MVCIVFETPKLRLKSLKKSWQTNGTSRNKYKPNFNYRAHLITISPSHGAAKQMML